MPAHDERPDQPAPRLMRHDGARWADGLPTLPDERDTPPAPTSLLAGVMARVTQLDAYLAPGATEADLLAATSAPAWETRAAASYALGAYATDAASAALATALHDDDVSTRVSAIHALLRQPARLPLDQMIAALRDPAWEVREAVALAVGVAVGAAVAANTQLADNARPLLLATLHDAHPAVRVAAHDALATLGAHATLATLNRVEQAATLVAPTTVATLAPPATPTVSTAPAIRGRAHSLPVALRHFWQTLIHQPTLIQRGWVIPALLTLTSELAVLLIAQRVTGSLRDMSILLAIVTAFSAAVGVAFGANMAHDPGVELALATPTSPRVILLARYCAVVGATFTLSGCASLLEAALYGQSLWAVVQLWLGPTLLLASLTLALVMLIGSWLSTLIACLLEIAQVAHVGPGGALLPLAQPHLWMTSPLVLALAALCLALALLYAPRQPRLFASFGDR